MRTSTGHIPYLDGWRGLAILCVYYGHFVDKAHYWWVGTFGVQLFFVLSGYLMCNILFIKNVALPDFFVSRLVRVFPTFVLFIGVLLVYSATLQPHTFVPSGSEILATITFLRTYFPADLPLSSKQWAIGHLWSLNVEEHSYLLLAGVALLTRRASNPLLTGACLVLATLTAWYFSCAYWLSPPAGPNHFSVRTEVASLGLLAGATIRYLRHWLPVRSYTFVPPWLPLASVAVAFLCFSTYMYKGVHILLAPILLACAINFLDRVPALIRTALSNRLLCWFGTCSFSLYLWQQPLHVLTTDYAANAVLMSALAIGIGAASFYGFENPVRKQLAAAWRQRRMPKGTPAAAGSDVVQNGAGVGVVRMMDD